MKLNSIKRNTEGNPNLNETRNEIFNKANKTQWKASPAKWIT